MKTDFLTNRNLRELDSFECSAIIGGSGIVDHLRCVRDVYRNSPVKTALLGVTIWGISRSIGILVGCAE